MEHMIDCCGLRLFILIKELTTYTYNDEGLMEKTSVKDSVSGQEYTTTTFYDELGRQSMVLDTDGGTTFYEYDCNGNITEKTEPAEQGRYMHMTATDR